MATSLDKSALERLVREAQEGDTQAFNSLYNHFFDQVYRYTAFRVSRDLAEDITADIFMKAWEKLHTYKQKKNVPFSAWLFRIARNQVIDSYRGAQPVEEIAADISDPDLLNRADSSIKQEETIIAVREAINRLPKRYQEVLTLSFMADLPHSEIARILRISEGTVRIVKFRALKKLGTLLPAEMNK